jgi:hypothetical protein
MPLFFAMTAFGLYIVLAFKYFPRLLPPKDFKPIFVGLIVAVLIMSYIVFVKQGRGNRIISEYEKSKSQKFYFWLGAIFSIASVSSPVWLFLAWRWVL